MKSLLKGFLLGCTLVVLDKICCILFIENFDNYVASFLSGIIFFFVITAFLVSKNMTQLFLCGFSGLFFMFVIEIKILDILSRYSWFDFDGFFTAYIGGFVGSLFAIPISILITIDRWIPKNTQPKEDITMPENNKEKNKTFDLLFNKISDVNTTKDMKLKLLAFGILSAMGFSYFVMPENVGIGAVIFTLLEFILMWFFAPNRKRLVLFIPLFIMALNCFISASTLWRTSNFIISGIIYACMFMNISFKKDSFTYLSEMLEKLIRPLFCFVLPTRWVMELNIKNASIIKKVAVALVIAVPSALILIAVLSSADMVFSMKAENLFSGIFDLVKFRSLVIIVCGIFVGIYLFGSVYCAKTQNDNVYPDCRTRTGDPIIISIIMATILFVYTAFVVVQFKYLFAGATLPEGLVYATYARKGFFELLGLTGINIAIILAVIRLTKSCSKKTKLLIKILCHYLCAITVVLLISSYYRMMLYVGSDGLTRLRLFVLGFLIFEAIGLIITFIYIAKPKFNISLVYIVISMCYYCLLNIIPVDYIIAENQVDLYLAGENDGIDYILTLSADTTPALEYLSLYTDDVNMKERVKKVISKKLESDIPARWQRYNYSIENAKKICDGMN